MGIKGKGITERTYGEAVTTSLHNSGNMITAQDYLLQKTRKLKELHKRLCASMGQTDADPEDFPDDIEFVRAKYPNVVQQSIRGRPMGPVPTR